MAKLRDYVAAALLTLTVTGCDGCAPSCNGCGSDFGKRPDSTQDNSDSLAQSPDFSGKNVLYDAPLSGEQYLGTAEDHPIKQTFHALHDRLSGFRELYSNGRYNDVALKSARILTWLDTIDDKWGLAVARKMGYDGVPLNQKDLERGQKNEAAELCGLVALSLYQSPQDKSYTRLPQLFDKEDKPVSTDEARAIWGRHYGERGLYFLNGDLFNDMTDPRFDVQQGMLHIAVGLFSCDPAFVGYHSDKGSYQKGQRHLKVGTKQLEAHSGTPLVRKALSLID